ncbi:MAG: hypothetical protein ABJN73_01690 [Nonlabens ulvanivorans]|uniref:Uncharacterized protein n=2 Tax=Nonlabens ulvanivorans TaxID=906888 RepID=A0A084JXK6_NONUL|nr:hypothetical protein [Nonlabens ulvanivorans]KEZ93690.1 hypothetical protein IL45_05665 [Nonlabens ulvanivorans]PRX14282.1 hypothetical protein LY02_01312 [Nonlabens ulvanivorans]WOI23171.1 hypothetical protein R1T42_01735 [Nonlabens ulvanivorans]GAK75966.1 hypothetical protein JCM19296_1563 [Nonlabens ulvanivorans]GAL75078.1 hypothetical protein JCM19275_1117 [Nonlabens ulvanivorans]
MKEKIQFEDLTALKVVVPTIIAVVSCFVFGTLIIIDGAHLYYIIPAFIGIILIGIPQIKNIRQRNTIKFTNTGLTAKLLGHKTFGFQFKEIEHYDLTEKGMTLKVNKMDEVTLSRKRFQEDSLTQLHTLIQQKTAQL